jgi:hypothetical protein
MRLLADHSVQQELALTDSEIAQIATIRSEYLKGMRVVALESNMEVTAPDAMFIELHTPTTVRTKALVALRELLDDTKLNRLRQLRYHSLGIAAAFVDGNPRELQISESQQQQFRLACVSSRTREFKMFVRWHQKSHSQILRHLEDSHRTALLKLDQTIGGILSETQKENLRDIMGQPPSLPIRIFDANAQYQAFVEKLRTTRPQLVAAESIEALAVNPVVQRLLAVTEREAFSLQAIIHKANAAMTQQEHRSPDVDGVFQEIRSVLGEVRWIRLRQIYLQIRGAAGVFSHHWSEEFKITEDQVRDMHRVISEIANTTPDAELGSLADIKPEKGRVREELDNRLLMILTDEQRKLWTEFRGEPVDRSVLDAILRAHQSYGARDPELCRLSNRPAEQPANRVFAEQVLAQGCLDEPLHIL